MNEASSITQDKSKVAKSISLLNLESARSVLDRNMKRWAALFILLVCGVVLMYFYGRSVFSLDYSSMVITPTVREDGLNVRLEVALDPVLGLGYTLQDVQLNDRDGNLLPLKESYVFYIPSRNLFNWVQTHDRQGKNEEIKGFTNTLITPSDDEYVARINLFALIEDQQDADYWENSVMPAELVISYTSCGFTHRSSFPLGGSADQAMHAVPAAVLR